MGTKTKRPAKARDAGGLKLQADPNEHGAFYIPAKLDERRKPLTFRCSDAPVTITVTGDGSKGFGSPAQALIAAARSKTTGFQLEQHALDHLKEICEYNDTALRGQRVSADEVLSSLKAHFGVEISKDTLHVVCQRQLGRKGFGLK